MRRRSLRHCRTRAGVAAVVASLLVLGPGLMAPAMARAATGSGGQSQLTTTSNPFSGGLTEPGETATTTTTPTTTAVVNTSTSASGAGFSGASAIAIAVAAFVIIVGIGAAIFRDARKRVGGGSRRAEPEERIPGSRRPPKARKLRPAERRRRKRGRSPRRR